METFNHFFYRALTIGNISEIQNFNILSLLVYFTSKNVLKVFFNSFYSKYFTFLLNSMIPKIPPPINKFKF